MTPTSHPLPSLLARTPLHTFVLMPIVVVACELILRGGTLAFDPWGVPLLILGYALSAEELPVCMLMLISTFELHPVPKTPSLVFYGTGGASWREGSLRESSSLRLFG